MSCKFQEDAHNIGSKASLKIQEDVNNVAPRVSGKFQEECTCSRGAGWFDTKWIYLFKEGWLIWYQNFDQMNVLVQGGLVYLIRSEFTCSRGAGWFDTNKCTCSRRAGWFDTKFLTKWMYLSKGGWFIWYEVNLLVQGGLVDLIPINVLVQGGLVDLIPNLWPNECTCPRGAGLFDTKWIYLFKGGWLIWYQ